VENPFARALVAGEFRTGDRIVADADAIGGTLVFSTRDATVVTDAADRRDARTSPGEPAAAPAGAGGRRRSPLELPPTRKDGDGGELLN
jgi:hypothetical protein